MFKTTSWMAAISAASALKVKSSFRPPDGSVPWHNGPDDPEWVSPSHKINYFVPHFGTDVDIKSTFANTAAAEEALGHVMEASFDSPAPPKRDYFVPHFGEDDDIKATKKNIAYAEGYHMHEYDTSPPPADPPRNYFVPHFGEDADIKATKSNIANAEKKYDHEYDTSPAPADPPRNYFVPHFGEDEDIKFTKTNVANAEAANGAWNPQRDGNGAWVLPGVDANKFDNFKGENNWPSPMMPSLIQTDSDMNSISSSDPICSSAGCTQYKHKKKERGYKINYAVPNFGRDKDINDDFESLATAEGMIGHTFQIGTAASKAKWKNPAKDVDYNFAPQLEGDMISTAKNLADAQDNLGHKWVIADVQLDSNVNYPQSLTQSDPICSSAGCSQYKHKKKDRGYKINYPVPNFGEDTDMTDNHASLALSEKAYAHKLEMATAKSKAKWANPAKDVDYNFAPKLDADMRTTAKNLGDAESTLGHRWDLVDASFGQTRADLRARSDPICSSAGCPKSAWTEEEEDKIVQYPVDVPLDYDVRTTMGHEDLASDQLGHVWHPKYFGEVG